MSMRDLGLKLGKPHQFVGKVESGERKLDIYEFVQYCKALGVKEEEGLYILSNRSERRTGKKSNRKE